ncbi:MAG: sulfotransferase [Cyanobacteria bacterium P01_D01_bin.156]
MNSLTKKQCDRTANSAPDTQHRFIFIAGNSRSGTTLMGQLLGRSSVAFTFEELHFFNYFCAGKELSTVCNQAQAKKILQQLLAIQRGDFLSPVHEKESDITVDQLLKKLHESNSWELSNVFEFFLRSQTFEQKKTISCEQTPANVFYINEILEAFPDSKIINMVRDPRDVLLSQKYKWRIRFLGATNIPYREAMRAWFNYHPVTTSKLWNSSIRAGEQGSSHKNVMTVKFEDLIVKPEETLRMICNFVHIPYDDSLLNVSRSEGGVSSHKIADSKKTGIDKSAVSKWKKGGLSETELHLCQQITKDNLEKYGYELASTNPGIIGPLFQYIILPVKLFLAVFFNLKRLPNLIAAIKKRL